MNTDKKVSFFKYNKQLFALMEIKGSEYSFINKCGGGMRYTEREGRFIGLFLDSELPPAKKSRKLHSLIKNKKLRKIKLS